MPDSPIGLGVVYSDDGVAIFIEDRRAVFVPVDHAAGLPAALDACAATRRETVGSSWAVTPDPDTDGVVVVFAPEVGAETLALPMSAATAAALAAAIVRAIDDRAALVVHDDDIQHADPDDFRR